MTQGPTAPGGGERLTVHQWLQRLAPDYWKRFGASMPQRHRRVLRKMLACRTPALGGQLFQCPDCSAFHYRYHSCNDRHCPQCGQTDADQWLARQQARLLLPTPYFLVTFTVPEALRRFIRSHQTIALNLLFACTAQALQDLARNPRRLGAELGFLGVLHTWSRTLIYHPHVHYLVPAGGLSPDRRRWVPARPGFLLALKPLGLHTCSLFKARLQRQYPELYRQVPPSVWRRHWNVDIRAAGSGLNALRYLSRYIFKTATSNRRIERRPNGKLRWEYRESQTGRFTAIELEPLEWMGRFLQHILPRGFARVRTFGWFHPAGKVRANRVRALLRQGPCLSAAEQQAWRPPADPNLEPPPEPTPAPARPGPLCPRCQQTLLPIGTWRPGQPLLLPKRPP